jgi:acetylornithine deacetylase/succinyl-diaminopimelate desuccinylase-like protein
VSRLVRWLEERREGMLADLAELRALRETGCQHPSVVFFFNSDEEVGSPNSRSLIEEEARRRPSAW